MNWVYFLNSCSANQVDGFDQLIYTKWMSLISRRIISKVMHIPNKPPVLRVYICTHMCVRLVAIFQISQMSSFFSIPIPNWFECKNLFTLQIRFVHIWFYFFRARLFSSHSFYLIRLKSAWISHFAEFRMVSPFFPSAKVGITQKKTFLWPHAKWTFAHTQTNRKKQMKTNGEKKREKMICCNSPHGIIMVTRSFIENSKCSCDVIAS